MMMHGWLNTTHLSKSMKNVAKSPFQKLLRAVASAAELPTDTLNFIKNQSKSNKTETRARQETVGHF